MTRSKTSLPYRPARGLPLAAVSLAVALAGAALIAAPAVSLDGPSHTVRPGLGGWWLPYNYSKHGGAIDGLFNVIFWLTTIIMIVVEVVLVVFLFKYRADPKKPKGKFIHGNARLEMIWTLIPAVILAVLALASKGVWDSFRYGEENLNGRTPAEVMVIGEQFKWNFIYPGKNRKLGQYMAYPHATDPQFRSMKMDKLVAAVNEAVTANPLGQNQDWTNDEAKYGEDDDWVPEAGSRAPLVLPVGTPIAIKLSSKDVIHDFFLPNFRVKLDALPGMAGRIDFIANPPTGSDAKDRGAQSTEDVSLDDPPVVERAKRFADYEARKATNIKLVATFDEQPFMLWVDHRTPGAIQVTGAGVSQTNYVINGKGPDDSVIPMPSRQTPLTQKNIDALKKAGVTRVTALTRPFELVCEELCGQGHSGMQSVVYFVSPEQYDSFIDKPPVTDASKKDAPITGVSQPPSPVAANK